MKMKITSEIIMNTESFKRRRYTLYRILCLAVVLLLIVGCTMTGKSNSSSSLASSESLSGIILNRTDDSLLLLVQLSNSSEDERGFVILSVNKECKIYSDDNTPLSIGSLEVGILVEATALGEFHDKRTPKEVTTTITSNELHIQKRTSGEYQKISAEVAKGIMNQTEYFYLLDVRSEEEYLEERIVGAVSVPVTEIRELIEEVVPTKQSVIMVYCRSGVRSASAAETLISLGYLNVFDIGGILSWPYDTVSLITGN